MSRHVIVLGGGVAGLSAAHELIERGFQVTVYEAGRDFGGKARSFGVAGTGTQNRKNLPAEHGFRFFPGFYKHLPDTMKRIPYPGNADGVFGNLRPATQMQVIFEGTPHIIVPARFPRSLEDVRSVLEAAGLLTTAIGLTPADIAFYVERVWQLLTSCEERRAAELECVNWWKYIDADNPARSRVYPAFLGKTPRVLVAADPKVANTKTVGDILVQLLFNLTEPGVSADRVLNGPTSDVWITPWLRHLARQGVDLHPNARVTAFECAGGRISAVRVYEDGRERPRAADYYVAAMPVEKMAKLVTPEMEDLDSTLKGIVTLEDHVDWMNGIQFYLLKEPPSVYGHQMFLSSDWALTSLSQVQFWSTPRDFARDYGDGTVRAVFSVDVSDWKSPATDRNSPVFGKPAKRCTIKEVAEEVWRQLKTALPYLDDSDLHRGTPWHVDPAIQPGNGVLTNDEQLLVNRTDSWALRPWARTRIPNLFLASDYVRTYTNLATMEAANEAARRAVNAILDESRVRQPPCRLWELHESPWVKPWRLWDLYRYRQGLPWAADIPDFVQSSAEAVLGAAPAIGGPEEYEDATARQVTENGIGVVPPYVQQDVAEVALDLASALGRGDVEMLRGLVVPDGQIVRDGGEPIDMTAAIDKLVPFFAEGGRIELDVQSLEMVRPAGRNVVARFVADLDLGADVQQPRRRGRLELVFSQRADYPDLPGDRPWLIRRIRYLA